jgi:hypothetical protein
VIISTGEKEPVSIYLIYANDIWLNQQVGLHPHPGASSPNAHRLLRGVFVTHFTSLIYCSSCVDIFQGS